MSFKIAVSGGKTVRLPTGGKYCDRDIEVTAEGGSVDLPELKNPGASEDLMEGKELIDGDGKVVAGTFTLQEEMEAQVNLIALIRAKLRGKAANGNAQVLPTQTKSVEITENGTVEVVPDPGYTLSKAAVTVEVPIPDGYIVPSGTLLITGNGSHDVKQYEKVDIDVPIPDEYVIPSGTKEITANGEHNVSSFEKASVNVPIPDGYIVPSGTQEITANGSYDVTDKSEVVVSVPEREILLQDKEVTENGEYDADSGYDGLGRVRVNVPIPDGYIVPSGTKEISANGSYDVTDKAGVVVAVPEREILLQDKEVTENGEYDADSGYDGLGRVRVNVPIPDGYIRPSGVKEVTENGEYDVGEYASVNVNVPTGGGDPKALLDASLNNTLTSIDSNVTSIVAYACRGLSKLKTVNLPNATSIGTYAFYYCTAMSSFSAPKVTTLNAYAFYNCDKISSINFPLATSIPTQCFYSCGVLKKADFGAAKSIAASAFPYCAELVTLILRRSDAICTLANKNAFTDTPIEDGTGYVYVPAALVDSYKAASNWSTYANQFRAIEDYPEITGGVTA